MKQPAAEHSGKHGEPAAAGSSAGKRLAHPILASVLLAAAAVAVYWPVAGHDFIDLDDTQYVASNPNVQRGLTWRGLAWAFQLGYASNWHPLTWMSHMLDAQVFGKGASGPHVVNLVFHAANAVLLFGLLRRLTGAHWRSVFVAALFALHPLHVESVAWISERKDVLSTFFGLLSLLAYAAYVARVKTAGEGGAGQTGGDRNSGRRCAIYYAAALLSFGCSLMSKPMVVTLPFLMLLLDFWPLRRVTPGLGRAELRAWLGLIREKWPFLLLAAVSCPITVLAQTKSLQPLALYSWSMRLENAVVACVSYIGKSFWPVRLEIPYLHPGHWPVAQVAGSALVLLAVSAAACWMLRRRPYVAAGWAWFLGMLVPVLGLVQVGEQAMADRYMYLPQTGLWLACVWGGAELLARWKVARGAVTLALVLTLAACAVRTRDQLEYWKDSGTLFGHSIALSPANASAHFSLGVHYDGLGRLGEAMECYRKALEANPKHALARYNLGGDLARQRRFEEADAQFRDALRLAPRSPLVLNNLGAALAARGQFDKAIDYYRQALRLAPSYAAAHRNLGLALAGLRRYEEAAQEYRESLRLAPDPLACNNLGYALAALGRRSEAVECYRKAIDLDPSLAEAQNNLGNALIRDGRVNEALVAFRRALELQPTNALVWNNLGFALAAGRQLTETLHAFETAVRLNPGFVEARLNLGDALAMQERVEEAVAQYQEAIRLEPRNPKTHFCFGRVLARIGQADAAIAQLNEAVGLNPDYTEARQLLQSLAPPPTTTSPR